CSALIILTRRGWLLGCTIMSITLKARNSQTHTQRLRQTSSPRWVSRRSTVLHKSLPLLLSALGIWLCRPASAAVTFTNTPAAVSNQYNGVVTLQIGGVTNGETVLIQQYMDINTNNVVDSADILIQQFQIKDGQGPLVIGGATNVNIPYDLNSAASNITA